MHYARKYKYKIQMDEALEIKNLIIGKIWIN